MPYKIALAGSSQYTVMMAEALQTDNRFEISYTISPTPKLIGRKQVLTKNPLQVWAEANQITNFAVEKKIDGTLQEQLFNAGEIDFLLVVDFGYLIPSWLLQIPKIAPLNVHPSLLPKWRGSSPGQFALLFKDLAEETKQSAVTLMIMNEGLDQGPIIAQLPFEIEENWTQDEYYEHAFKLMMKKLANLISDFAEKKITSQPQPLESPTRTARRLDKTDSFITWQALQQLMTNHLEKVHLSIDKQKLLNNLLMDDEICKDKTEQIQLIINASRAFSPWPGLWTVIKTNQGEKRMKIFACHIDNQQLILDRVQIEGKNPCLFRECKNALL
jgi:methionyl-tRNA formyltransferase